MHNTDVPDWIRTSLALAALREALDDVKRQLAERRAARETNTVPAGATSRARPEA